MDQLDFAIHDMVHNAPGGLETLAKLMNINAQSLRNKTALNDEKAAFLNISEFRSAVLNSGNSTALEVLCRDCGFGIHLLDAPVNTDLLPALLKLGKEYGDVNSTIADAISDGRITQRELTNIRVQINELLDAISDVVGAAESGAKQPGFKVV